MRTTPVVAAGLALALAAAPPSSAQAPAFTGAYRLTLTFGAACRASIASLSTSFAVSEATVSRGSEIDGRPALADDTPYAEVTLLRTGRPSTGPSAPGARGRTASPSPAWRGTSSSPGSSSTAP